MRPTQIDAKLKQQGARLRLRKFFCFFVLAAGISGHARGQATATATAGLQLSAFGGATGTYTGIGLGKNLSITAGADVTFRPFFFGLFPSVEVRGTFPVDKGSVAGEKNVLAGLVVARHLGRIQPYGDILVGRGELKFVKPYPNPADTEVYIQTASAVISPGAGANVFFTPNFALKGDFQFEHYESPVTASGAVYSKAFTLGVTYHLPFGGLGHGRR